MISASKTHQNKIMFRRFSSPVCVGLVAPLAVGRYNATATSNNTTATNLPPAAVEVYYDGKCSLCREEIGMLLRWDQGRNRVLFTDLNKLPGDDDMVNNTIGGGFSGGRRGLQERLTGKDVVTGEVLSGPATFRRMYSEIGSQPSPSAQYDTPPAPLMKARVAKWVFRLTGIPGFKQMVDAGYVLFADRRLRKLEEASSAKKTVGGGRVVCEDGSCKLYPKAASSSETTTK